MTLGEATPLDLFYSRATNFGDDYDLVDYFNSTTDELVQGFDWLEHDLNMLSGEAANTCNNGGTFYYAIWNQWMEDEEENVSNSDAHFRRLMWLPDETELNYAPVASILSAPNAALFSDQLTFVGSWLRSGQRGYRNRHRELRLVLEHRWPDRQRPNPGEGG